MLNIIQKIISAHVLKFEVLTYIRGNIVGFSNKIRYLEKKQQASTSNDFTSLKSSNESRGFWSVLARKAKAILDDEVPQQTISPTATSAKPETISFSTNNQVNISYFN